MDLRSFRNGRLVDNLSDHDNKSHDSHNYNVDNPYRDNSKSVVGFEDENSSNKPQAALIMKPIPPSKLHFKQKYNSELALGQRTSQKQYNRSALGLSQEYSSLPKLTKSKSSEKLKNSLLPQIMTRYEIYLNNNCSSIDIWS